MARAGTTVSHRTMLSDLMDHLEWADAEVWRAVLGSDAARADGKIAEWLCHVHTVQHAFLSVWRGEPPSIPAPGDFADLTSIAGWGRQAHGGLKATVGAADREALGRTVRVPWAAELERVWNRPIEHPTLAQTVLQVAMHSGYHRGQVNARLRELGAAPPLVDFIVWIWHGRSQPEWSFLRERAAG